MIKPTSHLLSRLALTAAVSLAVLVALVALRLFQGPLSLNVVTPFIENAMDDALEDYSSDIRDTVLRWSREEGRVDLRFVGITLRDKARRAVVAIPEMEVGFSVKALLRGLLAPSEIQLIGPSATIMRDGDGRIQLGFQAPDAEGPDIETDALLRKILMDLRTPKADSRLGYLERFYIRDAGLTLYDSITKSIWRAPNSLIALTRTAEDVVLRLDAKVEAGAGSFNLAAEGALVAGQNDIETKLHLNGLRLSKLAEGTHGLEPFAGVDVAVHGDATLTIALDGTIRRAGFWLFANGGHVIVPGMPSLSLDLVAAEAKGTFDAATDRIRLERLAYDAGTNRGFMVGNAKLARSPQGLITGISFDIDAEGIALDMPDLFSARGKIDHVALRGALDLELNRLSIDQAALTMGKTALKLAGTIDDRPEGLGVDIGGSLEHLAVTDFAKLWPIGPARGARDWITENIHSGEITRGALRIQALPGQLSGTALPDDVVDLTFEFDGLDVTYIRGLTPLTDAKGHARLTGNRFELEMTGGKIGPLDASDGHFSCEDLETRGAPGKIDVHLSGATADLLGVLDMEPLGYPTKFGIDPQTVGGRMAGRLDVVVPLRRAVHFADIVLRADAETESLSLPAVYRDFEVSDGALTFSVTNDALEAKGDAKLGGYPARVDWHEAFNARERGTRPTHISVEVTLDGRGRARAVRALDDYIEGPTPITLAVEGTGPAVERLSLDVDMTPATVTLPQFDWSKPAGAKGRLHFAADFPSDGSHIFRDVVVEGPALAVKGEAVLDGDGGLKRAAFDPFRIGERTDTTLTVERAPRSGGGTALRIAMKGRAFYAGRLLRNYKDDLEHAPAGTEQAADASRDTQELSADLETLTLAHDVTLNGVAGRYESGAAALYTLSGKGTFASGAPLTLSLTPNADGTRALAVESADAGAFLLGLDLTDNVESGTFALTATLPPLDSLGHPVPDRRVEGVVSMKNVRLVRAPILTKVLSVGSFGGIRDMLNGEGLLFESVELPFAVEGKTIAVGSGRAYGPSVGLTIEGHVPRGGGDYDMSGTLVPAYTLNTLLGYVPVLGKLLTSREGEGVVGLTYQVRGDANDPHVLVNPLSALTPGFLRRIFQFGDKVKDGPTAN